MSIDLNNKKTQNAILEHAKNNGYVMVQISRKKYMVVKVNLTVGDFSVWSGGTMNDENQNKDDVPYYTTLNSVEKPFTGTWTECRKYIESKTTPLLFTNTKQ